MQRPTAAMIRRPWRGNGGVLRLGEQPSIVSCLFRGSCAPCVAQAVLRLSGRWPPPFVCGLGALVSAMRVAVGEQGCLAVGHRQP